MRKLFLDIETSPHVAYCWRLYDETIGLSQVIEPTRMLCVAYGFDDEPVQFAAEWQRGGHEGMVNKLHAALDEADLVIHYNGASFDEKHLNREMLELGLTPPATFQTVDLFQTIKAKFRFASNKLEWVAKRLEIRDGKLKTDFELWRRVMEGDKAARKEMEEYAIEDTKLVAELYVELLPWITRHPNAALFAEDGVECCTRCQSTNLIKYGTAYTMAGNFQRYRCKDCGSQMRGAKRQGTTPLRPLG